MRSDGVVLSSEKECNFDGLWGTQVGLKCVKVMVFLLLIIIWDGNERYERFN